MRLRRNRRGLQGAVGVIAGAFLALGRATLKELSMPPGSWSKS